MDKDILYLQYWQDEEQNMPYVNYNGIMANAWIKEDKFAGKVNTIFSARTLRLSCMTWVHGSMPCTRLL